MRLLRNDTDQTLEFDYNREDDPEEDRIRAEMDRIEAERRLEEDERFQEAMR